jgi:hypothetical protein
LWEPKEEWPKEPEGLGELMAGMFDFGSQTDSSFAKDLEGQAYGDSIFSKVSSLKKLTKVVAWWLKLQARHHRVHSETVRKLTFNQPLTVAEVEKAENPIMPFVQWGA